MAIAWQRLEVRMWQYNRTLLGATGDHQCNLLSISFSGIHSFHTQDEEETLRVLWKRGLTVEILTTFSSSLMVFADGH
jgi:hypothetical protein